MHINYNEYAPLIIQRFSLKGAEPSGPCPNCGGTDRFRINNYNGELKHHCRKGCDFMERHQVLVSMGLLPEPKSEVLPYHFRKQIPLINAHLKDNNVIVPLVDVITREPLGQQTIRPDGTKRFNKGLKKTRACAFIGEPSEKLIPCEGYATAVAVHVATGQQTVFALDADNLPKIVKHLDHPNIIIGADNDDKGIAAAEATGLPYAAPERLGADWCDVYNHSGQAVVSEGFSGVRKLPDDPLSGLALSSALDLSNKVFSPIIWLIEGLIPVPNLVLLAGAPKIGKSFFVTGLAEAIASMGHRVIYIANEDNERRLKDRYEKISDFPTEKLTFISGLSSEKSLPTGKAAHLMIRALKDRYPDLKCLIIDTIQAIRDTSQKQDYGYVEREFSELRKLAHDLEITIIAVHHTKKKTDFEAEPLDTVLGSQAIVATVETILIMQRVVGSQNVDLFITGKDVEQREDYRLTWTDRGFSDPEDRTLASLGPIQKAILEYVKQHPRCTQASICDALGKSKQQVNAAVNRLLEMELLKSAEGARLICSLTQ